MTTMVVFALLLLAMVEIAGADAAAISTENMIWAALLVIGDMLI